MEDRVTTAGSDGINSHLQNLASLSETLQSSSGDQSSSDATNSSAAIWRLKIARENGTTMAEEKDHTVPRALKVPQTVRESQLASLAKLSKLITESSTAVVVESEEVVPDAFKCGVCHELVVLPRRCFPCAHSFCEPCLRLIANAAHDRMRCFCPLCRCSIYYTLPNEDVVSQINAADSKTVDAYKDRVDSFADQERVRRMPLPGIPGLQMFHQLRSSIPLLKRLTDKIGRKLFNPLPGNQSHLGLKQSIGLRAISLYFIIFCATNIPLVLIDRSFRSSPTTSNKILVLEEAAHEATNSSFTLSNSTETWLNGTAATDLPDTDPFSDNTTSSIASEWSSIQRVVHPELGISVSLSMLPIYLFVGFALTNTCCFLLHRVLNLLFAFNARRVTFTAVLAVCIAAKLFAYYFFSAMMDLLVAKFANGSAASNLFGVWLWFVVLVSAISSVLWGKSGTARRRFAVRGFVLAAVLFLALWLCLGLIEYNCQFWATEHLNNVVEIVAQFNLTVPAQVVTYECFGLQYAFMFP